MATKFKSITAFLIRVARDMIQEQASQGIRNTGRSAKSVKIFETRIEAVGYWNFLFSGQGTPPGKFPNFGRILKWVKKRGLRFRRDSGKLMSEESTAFMVGNKIRREGTDIFQKPQEGVNLDKILERHQDQLTDELGTELQQKYIQDLNKVIISR